MKMMWSNESVINPHEKFISKKWSL